LQTFEALPVLVFFALRLSLLATPYLVAMFVGGVLLVANFLDVTSDGVRHDLTQVGVMFDVPCRKAGDAEHVGCDKNLSVASWTCADADRRHLQRLRDFGGQGRGDCFQDDGKATGVLQCQSGLAYLLGTFSVAALHAPATEAIYRLWRE